MQLHTPTLLLVNVAVAAALSICMGVVAQRSRRDGMVYWSWAMALFTLAYLLFGLRGQISDWLSVVLSNTLLVATYALFVEGLSEFQQRRPRRWLIWSPVVLVAFLLGLLLPQPATRSILAALVLTFEAMIMLQLVVSGRHTTVGRGQYFVMIGFAIIILALLTRLLGGIAGYLDLSKVTDSHPLHAAAVLFSVLIIVVITVGLLLMTKERADALNRNLALQDELTGLHNRRSIQRLLDQQLAQMARGSRSLALLLIDVDHFKGVNDTHGHLSGDKVLRQLADGLQQRLRAQDILGRWGGEEFIVILPDTHVSGARQLAEQLRQDIETLPITTLTGKVLPLTISIGLHVDQGGGGRDEIIAEADRALYQAKQNGRNRVEASGSAHGA
jgi:diguanylate cyclase (GGDEF)-like protein